MCISQLNQLMHYRVTLFVLEGSRVRTELYNFNILRLDSYQIHNQQLRELRQLHGEQQLLH